MTHRPHGAKPQVRGGKGRPAGNTLSQFRPRLGGYVPKVVYERIQYLKVRGDWEEWPACHVDGHPVVHHLKTDTIKSVEAPATSI
jgi:hypothetical protein